MFGIVFATLLGVSLILISRIDQHLACRKSSLAVLCRSGSSVQRQTPLNFLVVGDWGRNGLYNQSLVAEQVTWGVCYMYHLNDEIFCLRFFSFMCTPLSSVSYTTDGECGSPTQCQLHNIHWRQFL
jgi:hypothetical protein